MPKIILEDSSFGSWNPWEREISLPSGSQFQETRPMTFAHELGHSLYDHMGSRNPYYELLEERDAWKFALGKLPPEEIDLDFLETSLDSYLEEIVQYRGEESQIAIDGRRIKREIMGLARRKKHG